MKLSSGESAPEAIMSRSETSRDVSATRSRFSTPSGRSPVRSTRRPPCGRISFSAAATTLMPPFSLRSKGGSRCDLSPDQPELLEPREHESRAPLRLVVLRVQDELRGDRLLVRVVDAGEPLQLAGEGLLVEPLHVAAGA